MRHYTKGRDERHFEPTQPSPVNRPGTAQELVGVFNLRDVKALAIRSCKNRLFEFYTERRRYTRVYHRLPRRYTTISNIDHSTVRNFIGVTHPNGGDYETSRGLYSDWLMSHIPRLPIQLCFCRRIYSETATAADVARVSHVASRSITICIHSASPAILDVYIRGPVESVLYNTGFVLSFASFHAGLRTLKQGRAPI